MARREEETYQEYLESGSQHKDGAYRTRDGRIFETALAFPDKLTVEEFIDAITCYKTNQAFIDNMHHLEGGTTGMPEKRHAEDWIQTYLAWMEMEDK